MFSRIWGDRDDYVFGMDILLYSLRLGNYNRPFVLDLRNIKLYFIAMNLLLNKVPLSEIYF
jgi:hypothetical protein